MLFDSAAPKVLRHRSRIARVPFDDSETEDIVLIRDAAEPVDLEAELSSWADADGEPSAEARGRARTGELTAPAISHANPKRPPRRIGHGKLVASRVQWRPGDPFGQATRAPVRGFEWNRMVRSACVTAACGLILVWLLHIA